MSEPEPAVYEAVEMAGKQPKWRLLVYPHGICLEAPGEGGEEIEVPRAERVERMDFMSGLVFRRLLGVKVGKKTRLFKLVPAGFAALQAWAGPPTLEDLKKALRVRFKHSAILGVLLMLASAPLPGVAEQGLPPIPFNPVSCSMGVALILMGILARFMPHRAFFLLDCIWVGGAAASSIEMLITERFSLFTAFLLLIQANYIVAELREFVRFAALRPDPEPPGR